MERISASGPWITQTEFDFVNDALANAWGEHTYVYNDRFEREFAEFVGVRYAAAVSSGTAAIHLGLMALGIGPGDEVIVPELTWIASAAPILYVGAQPVMVDVDPHNWCLCPQAFAAAITPRTKAVIPVDLYGNIPDMDAIRAIAAQYQIAILEDSAEAIGARYGGRSAGALGDVGIFSFHSSKTLTTGEGGMFVTDRQDLYERALTLRDHGRRLGDKMFHHTEIGYKYKMGNLQAALGLAQLQRIDELVARKRQIFDWYQAELSGVAGVTLNQTAPGVTNSYWMTCALFHPSTGLTKQRAIEQMAAANIECRPFFPPLSDLPAFAEISTSQRHPVSQALSLYGINLPSGAQLTQAQVQRVCQTLKSILQESAATDCLAA
jgi:perosamine synthetase